MQSQGEGAIDRIFADPDVMRRGFRQAVSLPVKTVGLASKGLTLVAIVVFFTDPNPHGLVNAAWFYIIAQILSLIVEGAVGWSTGLKQTKFFASLPENHQRELTTLYLTNHALEGFFGFHTPVLFSEWHGPVIREILDKNLQSPELRRESDQNLSL